MLRGGVDVPVVDRAARAGPLPDVQGLGLADGPARRARPGGGEPAVDPGERPPVPPRLVVEHRRRTSTSPRRARCGRAGSGPGPDTARSSTYTAWFSRIDRGRQLVQPVPAGVPDPGMTAGDLAARASPVAPSPSGGGRVPAARVRSFAAALRAIRGASTFRPSDSTAKCVRPRSIPTSRSVGGSGASGTSTTNEAWYRPVASTVTVTIDGSRRQRRGTSAPARRRSRAAAAGPPAVTRNRAALVNRIDCARSRLDRNRGAPSRAALARALHRGEEVPVRGVRVRQRLLQHHRRHLGQPRPLRGPLRRGQRLGQRRVGRERLPRPRGRPGGRRSRR